MGSKRRRGHLEVDREWPDRRARPKSTAQERHDWARDRWREDPNITLNGRAGMQSRLLEVFGIAARDSELIKIRQEVLAEKKAEPEKRAKSETVLGQKLSAALNRDEPPPPRLSVVKENSRTIAARKRAFALKHLAANPRESNETMMRLVAERFTGSGIGAQTLREIREELNIGRYAKPRGIQQAEPTNSTPAPSSSTPAPSSSTLRAAIQMLIDEMPTLRRLEMTIVDGKPHVTYELATVKRFEL